MHMRGLETIINIRGGLSASRSSHAGLLSFSTATMQLILSAGHDLASYAARAPYFESEDRKPVMSTPTLRSPGLEELRRQRLLLPSLLSLIDRLSSYNIHDQHFLSTAVNVRHRLVEWTLSLETSVSYCPTQTLHEDNIKQQASALIRLAGLTLCEFFTGMHGQEGLHALYEEALLLHPEPLIGTLYEELTFWALTVISSTTGRCEAKHMRSLKRLQLELSIRDWMAARGVLSRYVYPADTLDGRTYNLWQAIDNSMIARDVISGNKEPNVLAKGIQHPPTHIGTAIAAATDGA